MLSQEKDAELIPLAAARATKELTQYFIGFLPRSIHYLFDCVI